MDVPIYEYTCASCEAGFEQLVRTVNTEAPAAVKCPSCGSAKTRRLMSVFAVGAEAKSQTRAAPEGGCGRCGGPGPCPSEY